MILYFSIFFICLFIIIKSGTLLVKTLVSMSRYLGVSEYVVAFILMAMATSVPELFIGITSGLHKTPAISLGNIIGANMLNLTLGLGIVILTARGINLKTETAKKDGWIIFFLAILPLLLASDRILSRTDGIILFLFFIWYISKLLSRREQFKKTINHFNSHLAQFNAFMKSLGLFLIGLILLMLAAWGIVQSTSKIAENLDLSLMLIGLILVALGTTLPEISFGVRAILLKHEEMTIGTFIGSIAFNSLAVLGITAIIYPIEIDNFPSFINSALFLVLSLIVFNVFIRTKQRLSYKEGIILIIIYAFFLTIEMLIR